MDVPNTRKFTETNVIAHFLFAQVLVFLYKRKRNLKTSNEHSDPRDSWDYLEIFENGI